MKHISSRDNPLFKHLRALVDDARYRRQHSATIADGEHLVVAALDAGWPMERIVVRADNDRPSVLELLHRAQTQQIEIVELADELFDRVSPVVTPSGVLCEIKILAPAATDPSCDVLALAGVQDAGNLGTLLRSAAASGIETVWCDAQCAQAWSPKVLRAGMGAHFHLSIFDGCNLPDLLTDDARQKLVTCLDGETVSLYELDLGPPSIWIFGSEGGGVPAELRDLADRRVRIPMSARVESLNVAAAAAVCFFEQLRQRQNGK